MKNGIEDLRNHLFEMLEDIKDPDKKIDLARYRLGMNVAETLIDSAKVEVDLLKVTNGKPDSAFFCNPHRLPPVNGALTDQSKGRG